MDEPHPPSHYGRFTDESADGRRKMGFVGKMLAPVEVTPAERGYSRLGNWSQVVAESGAGHLQFCHSQSGFASNVNHSGPSDSAFLGFAHRLARALHSGAGV